MMAVRFIFIACLSMLVARVSSSKHCPGNTDHFGPLSYEPALTNSINKCIKNLRDGTSGWGFRLLNSITIDNSTAFDVINHHGNMSYHLERITIGEFSDLHTTDVGLNSNDDSSVMKMIFYIRIPRISGASNYFFNGTWNEAEHNGYNRMDFHYHNLRAAIRITIKLAEDREHWELKELQTKERDIHLDDEQINLGYLPFDDVKTLYNEILKEQITAKLEKVLAKHLKTILRNFLRELFEKIPWYATIFGRFDPDDHELYDE